MMEPGEVYLCSNCRRPYSFCRCDSRLSIPVLPPRFSPMRALAQRIRRLSREDKQELLRELERGPEVVRVKL